MTFKIFWSEEDQGFVCVVPDLPGCCAVGDSRQEAAEAISDAIIAWKEADAKAGNRIQPPCHTFADDVLSPDSQTDKQGRLR